MTAPAPRPGRRTPRADRRGTIVTGADGRLTGRLLACGDTGSPLLLCIHGGGCDGRYFDLPGFSLADEALARGHDVLLLDRPGHGASAPARTATPIAEAADLLPAFLRAILHERASSALAVIGHSIGGAVALRLAAENGAAGGGIAIDAVVVSGIGRVPGAAALAWLDRFEAEATSPPPELFFGPRGSYDWRAPGVLRRITAPWRLDEVRETLHDWPRRFDEVAARVRVPVLVQLAEHEAIWRAEDAATGDLARRFTSAPRAATALLLGGGHLYELHASGAAMVRDQLAFIATARTAQAAHARADQFGMDGRGACS